MSRQYSLEESDDLIRLRGAWQTVTERLSAEVPKPMLERFIVPLQPAGYEDDLVQINAPGTFVADWVRSRYLGTIQAYLSDELGQSITLQLIASPRERKEDPPSATLAVKAISDSPTTFSPHPKYRFDNYIVGQSNRLAHAGAMAVSAGPGKKYNPLFIYGPSGLGKTHLLHAIAAELLRVDPGFKLIYTSAQNFTEEFISAVQTNRVEAFRRQNRQYDVWLVDDIQFIAGKDRTQEEIFHTFNHMHGLGKQIVLCSDRPPRDLSLMDERLRSRFEAGLVADVQMPDTETRSAIVLSKAALDGIELPHDVAMYIAENIPGNIRVLEGALTKISAMASLGAVPLDLALAREVAEHYYRQTPSAKANFGDIILQVSKHYNIPEEDIRGTSRRAPIVQARHVAVWLMREITGDSWKHIGSLFGDRDHTSMMHAYNKISEQMHHDRDVRTSVKSLYRTLHPS
ncbi:MAG: chromosomal replication initiator protein DnaA [Armatimonadota bacterium]